MKKIKIAMVTPWPNQRSGISNYVKSMMPYWAVYFDIDIFVPNVLESQNDYVPNEYGDLYMLHELDNKYQNYEEIVYQMGNDGRYHKEIYLCMLKYKGIVEIHDYIMHPFFYNTFYTEGQEDIYKDALINGYGEKGLQHYHDIVSQNDTPDNVRFPMSHSLVHISKKAIFHNKWSINQVQMDNTCVIPHACFDKKNLNTLATMDSIKNKITYQDEFLISCFGFVNENKRPRTVIEAAKFLINHGYNIKVAFFGESNYQEIENVIVELNMQEYVVITGFLDEAEYQDALEITDLVINLRYPSMGEASGTLCEAFKYGKAVIVSAVGQYLEFPDDICWKIPTDYSEFTRLVSMMEYLLNESAVREALGNNAREYAETILNPSSIAKMHYDSWLEV